jgi:hypothetical protein
MKAKKAAGILIGDIDVVEAVLLVRSARLMGVVFCTCSN